jgi:hypothetical protein
MEIEKILSIFGPLFGIIGIVIGWGLNQWSGLSKIRRENRKSLKIALVDLLEVHFIISRLDDIKVTNRMLEIIAKQFGMDIDNQMEIEKFLKPNMDNWLQILRQEIFPHLTKRIPRIKENYENSLSEIKGIIPIIAFRLSGKTEILDYLNNLEKIVETSEIEDIDKQVNINLMRKISPTLRKDILDSFEEEILSLAYQIGIITWNKT